MSTLNRVKEGRAFLSNVMEGEYDKESLIGRFAECSLRPPRVTDGQTHCGQKMYEIDVLSAGPSACPLARSLSHSRAHGKEVYAFEMNASISYSFNPQCTGSLAFITQSLVRGASYFSHRSRAESLSSSSAFLEIIEK